MASETIRVPEDSYGTIRNVAVKLNVPISEAAGLVLETGIRHFRLEDHLSLDSDLEKKRRAALIQEADTDTEILDLEEQELYPRQVDRNRERSDLAPGTQ